MIKDKYECIIIGGGLGGTVMASMLALYGVEVLLAEKNHFLGGCVTDYEVGEFVCSHSIDWFSGIHEKGKLHYWFERIGLLEKLDFKELEAFKRVITPDYNVCLYSDFNKFQQELHKNFPNEAQGINKLIELIKSFGGSQWSNYFRPYREKRFSDLLDDYFVGEEIKTILSANLNDDMSAYLYVLFLYRCLSKEIYMPADKTLAEVFKIIEDRIIELGAEVLKNANVDRITTEEGRANGVVLSDGRKIKCDGLITDIDLRLVYNQLLPPNSVNNYFMTKLNSRDISDSVITTFLGVNKTFEGVSVLGEPVVYAPTYCREDKYSDDPQKWHVKINIKSLAQPYICPQGKSAIDIRTFMPQDMMGSMIFSENYRREERYLREKECLEKELISLSEKILGDYKDDIVVKRTATPCTFERYTRSYHGSAMGWAIEPIEFTNGFRVVSPLNNLFHVGSWASFPGIEGVVNYCFSIIPRIVKFYGKV